MTLAEQCLPVLVGRTLNIDVEDEDGKVTGEFRIDNVVVSVQCARTIGRIRRDLILGGEVTANPNDLATLDGVGVALGDLVALAIREGDDFGQRVTLCEKSSWHGEQATSASCDELISSFPPNLDGGFFEEVKGAAT